MTISMYAASAPALLQMLGSLSIVLKKTADYAKENGKSDADFLQDRLIDDMLPMVKQVQIACDHAKAAMARISGQENPKFDDSETTFAELQDRIARTADFVKGFTPADLDGHEDVSVIVRFPGNELTFKAQDYLVNYALPNFYFHVSMAYAIARKNGVPVGKGNFMGRE